MFILKGISGEMPIAAVIKGRGVIMYQETTESSDTWALFIASSIITKNYTRGRTLNSDLLRECMNTQVMPFQTYVRKGYGLSVSEADFIAKFPLPENVSRTFFLLEILDLADKVCFHRIDRIIISKDRKTELMINKEKILALASVDAGDYLYGDSFRYSWIHSEVMAILYRCSLNHSVRMSVKLKNNVEKLASIIAFNLNTDRIGFTFKELMAVTNCELVKKGLTKDSVAYRVNKRVGLNKSQLKNILDGEQKNTSLTMIGEIAGAIGTDTTLLFEKAEQTAMNRRNGKSTG
jgi:hypothetical protein